MADSNWNKWFDRASRIWKKHLDSRLEHKLNRPYPEQLESEALGKYGERIAAIFLERKGYVILERSYRLKIGEIDLIALWNKRVVVFVEVKTWDNVLPNDGGPSDAVTLNKQAKITRTALAYLKQHQLVNCSCRADVIAIVKGTIPNHPQFTHYENAFEPIGQYQFFS